MIAIVANHVAGWSGDRRNARTRSIGRATAATVPGAPADPLIGATLSPGGTRDATPGGAAVARATGTPTSVASGWGRLSAGPT